MKNLVNSLLGKRENSNARYKRSYSQCGEDLIVKFIFDTIGVSKPRYMDIGAHHPYYLNNTALFYENESTGINIEPDPTLHKEFLKSRDRDVNLNIGIADSEGELDFFVMNVPTLNTFSKEEAEKYKREGNYFVEKTERIPVKTVAGVLKQYNNGGFPEFLTIDAEGIDEVVLRSIDYSNNYPTVICSETISFSNSGKGIKNLELIEFVKSRGYMLYADTYINSIFLREDKWIK